MIRVLIKASSPVVKAGLETLIRSHDSLQIVEDSSAGNLLRDSELGDSHPDVILAEMESRDEEAASEVLAEAAGAIPIVLLVRGPTSDWAGLLRQGVKAILPSNATTAQITAAIEAVDAGLTVIDSAEIENLLPSPRASTGREILLESLTHREIGVLRAMAEGLSNKEIAARLNISEHTVKFHVGSIMGKLGAASRTEAVTIGIRHGLVLI